MGPWVTFLAGVSLTCKSGGDPFRAILRTGA